MKLARPQLRLPLSREDNNIDSSTTTTNMPPSFANLTAEAARSSHRKKSSTKKKEKGTHKRSSSHHSSGTNTNNSSKRSSSSSHNRSPSTPLPTIYAENRESFTDDKDDQGSSSSDHPEEEEDDRKMPASISEQEKAATRRASQDAFVPAQLKLKSKSKKNKSKDKSSSRDSRSRSKNNKKSSMLSSKTSSTATMTAATEQTEWDDLGDEIAIALDQSLGIGGPVTAATTATRDNEKSPKKKKSDRKSKTKHNNSAEMDNEDDEDGPPWKCPACTFKNEPLHLVCAVCGTAAAAATSNNLGRSFSSSSNNGGHLRSSSLFSSTYNHQYSHNSRYYGSFENLESLTRSYSTAGGGGGYPNNHHYNNNHNPANNDPHSHRRMTNTSSRQNSDDMSYDSEAISYNIQDQVDYQLRDRENSYHGDNSSNNNHTNSHRNSREFSRSDYHHRRRTSTSADDMYYRHSRRATGGSGSLRRSGSRYDDIGPNIRDDSRGDRDRDRGGRSRYSQSLQINSNHDRGGYSGGGASVNSGRYSRSRRRDNMYDDDSLSLGRRSRSSLERYDRNNDRKDYRKSTMMDMEYGGHGRDRDRDFDRSGSASRYRGSRGEGRGGDRYRDDYSEASESLGTKGRITGGQYYDEGSIISEMSDDDGTYAERTVRTMQTIKKMVIPSGEVTIIYTDVQGSTALWEADPMSMKKATDIHDSIMRRCYSDHGGYEITTEGDAFNIAFQHPADAVAFALKAQLALYRAKWPEGTLKHPDGCDNEKKKFRGFRVRFGMHHGPTTSTVHKTTGRTTYQGEGVEIAKAIEKMSHGGQILTTVETWRTVSGMAEQLLGSPQVMDCGEHLLWDPKKSDLAKKKKRVLSKRIVQLVPNSLSYDFFAARGGQEVKEGETPRKVCGRVFPPLLSHGQLSTSFLNAPYIGNKVAMVFVYTDKMEAIEDKERKKNYKILAKYVRSHLMRLSPPGYECQEDKGSWMLAFDRIDNGINFGLDLKENVMKNAKLLGEVDKSQVFRVGIHWGPFLSMGPHTVTGHADYFGPIVNRAARVAAQCEPGQVCVGVPMGTDEEPPDPGPTVEVDVLGVKQLKGISIEMAIFGCRKKEKEAKEEES